MKTIEMLQLSSVMGGQSQEATAPAAPTKVECKQKWGINVCGNVYAPAEQRQNTNGQNGIQTNPETNPSISVPLIPGKP